MNLMTKKEKKSSILSGLILLIFTIYILFLIILNTNVVRKESAVKYLIIAVPVFAACIFIAIKLRIPQKIFLPGLFILAFLSKAFIVMITDTQPVSDFKMFYDHGKSLLSGYKVWTSWSYFRDFAYQTGPITYYFILMKILGTGLLPLKLVNCIFMAGTNTLIYLIARKITNESAARSAALLYMFYPAPYFLAPVLTNQHFAAFMIMAAIYILMLDNINFAVRSVTAGILAAAGNAVRPLGVVVIAALIVWCIIELIRQKKIIIAGLTAIMIISYYSTTWGISAWLIHEGISPYGLENNFPLWKFVVGLNEKTSGQYSQEDQTDIFYIEDLKQREETAKKLIKERLSIGPERLTRFLVKKQEVMWAGFDTLRWGFYVYKDNTLVPPAGFEVLERRTLKTERAYYYTALVLLAFGMIVLIFRKINITPLALYIILLLSAYFSIHILIEIQVRYRYFAMISVFILLSYGIQFLTDKKRLRP